MDPDCREAKNIRNQISRILDEIKSFESFIKRYEANIQEMMASLNPCEPVGVLLNRNLNLNIQNKSRKVTLYLILGEDGKYSIENWLNSWKDVKFQMGERNSPTRVSGICFTESNLLKKIGRKKCCRLLNSFNCITEYYGRFCPC